MRTLGTSLQWHERSSATDRCVDCGAVYFERDQDDDNEPPSGDRAGEGPQDGDGEDTTATSHAPISASNARCGCRHRPDHAWQERQRQLKREFLLAR